MITRIVELTNGFNWGKFLVCRFDQNEWRRRSAIPDEVLSRLSLLRACGWESEHLGVFDLQTGEGAFFLPGGRASADLEKHAIWVCPMYECFLTWLYRHRECWADFDALPEIVTLTDEETRGHSAVYGHRRNGGAARLAELEAEIARLRAGCLMVRTATDGDSIEQVTCGRKLGTRRDCCDECFTEMLSDQGLGKSATRGALPPRRRGIGLDLALGRRRGGRGLTCRGHGANALQPKEGP